MNQKNNINLYSKYNNFIKKFKFKINSLEETFSDYIFLCVGTNKIIGDSFGPIVGENLLQLGVNEKTNMHVIGNRENPVTYINLDEKIKQIKNKYERPCIIAIDSALGKTENIGKVIIINKKMKLGEGVAKREKTIGDISIKAIVEKNHNLRNKNYNSLENVHFDLINNLAQITAQGIQETLLLKE